MGFFDALNSEMGREGLAMLAAAGPQAQPMNFGQRMMLAQALQDSWGDRDQKRKLQEMQLREAESQIRARDLAAQSSTAKLAQQQRVQDMIAARLSGMRGGQVSGASAGQGVPPGMDPGAAGGPVTPTGGGGAGSGGFPFDVNDVALLQASGGPDLLPALKFASEGIKREAGATYIDPVTGKREYMPRMAEGVALNNGVAGEVPGYGRAVASIEGARTGANEAAKYPYSVGLERNKADISAANDLVTVTLPGGQTLQLPRSMVLEAARGQGMPQQQGNLPTVGGGQQLSPALRDLISRDAAANGIDNPTTAFTGARRGQGYGLTDAAPAGGTPGLPGLQVQSPAGAAFQNATATGDAKQLEAWREGANAANSALDTARNLRAAEAKGVFTGGGAQAKTAASSLLYGLTGIQPKGLVGSEQFNAAAATLVLDRIKALGANPSNADRDFIERTVPNLQQSPEARRALVDFIESKAQGAISLHRRADTYARQNNGLGGFDPFAQPQPPQGGQGGSGSSRVVNFMDLK